MSHFRELYEFRQGLSLQIDPMQVKAKLRELLPHRSAVIAKSKLDPSLMAGYYISARNADIAFHNAVPTGSSLILISNSLNVCWTRFVMVKELLHLCDDPLHSTNNADEFEQLLVGIHGGLVAPTQQVESEYNCMWLALALMCREEDRLEFERHRDAGALSDLDIATQLRMPERFVTALFNPDYKELVAAVID